MSKSSKNKTKLNDVVDVVADFGADPTGVADSTSAIQAALTYGGPLGKVVNFPAGQYKITSGLTYSGSGGIYMEACGYGGGGAGDFGIYPVGTGYTALTISGSPHVIDVCVGGAGQTLNGVYLNNVIVGLIQKIRVYNFNGFGVRIDKCWDTVMEVISIELCGNTGSTTLNTYSYPNYAFSMNDAGDTCNMSHISRLQVEQAQYQAILISGNTLSCVIDNIHSERATTNVSYPTWMLNGNRGLFNATRLNALVPSTASASISGNNSQYNTLEIEGAISSQIQGNNGSSITLVSPEIQGTISAITNQTGIINVLGGYIFSLLSQGEYWNVTGTKITNLNVGYCAGPANQMQFNGCNISILVSNSTTAAATFNNCVIASCGNLLQASTVINGGAITNSGTITLGYNATYLSGVTVSGSIAMNGNTTLQLTNGTTVSGGLSVLGGQQAVLADDSSYFSGTVSYTVAPNYGTWPKGARTRNLAPAVGSAKAYVCTVAGSPGTWVSEGNL